MELLKDLRKLGVIPVVKIEQAEHAAQLADTLNLAGLPCAEITFRTGAAEQAIKNIAATHPRFVVGAGTVLSVTQAQKAVNAGARFIVSPGFDPKVVDWCLKNNILVIPGVATPTEALMALDKGIHVLKFFPAEALGGIPMLEAISAALIGIEYVPTGGITAANLAAYLRLPVVFAVGGSWLATSKMISAGDFDGISSQTAEAVEIVHQVRQIGESS